MSEPLKLITQADSWKAKSQPEVIEKMEQWLEMVKSGEVIGVAIAGEGVDGLIHTELAGVQHRGLMLGALAHLQYRLAKWLDEGSL